MLNAIGQFPAIQSNPALAPLRPPVAPKTGAAGEAAPLGGAHEFGNLFTKLVEQVDATRQSAAAEAQKVMMGQSDQVHSAVIALQESSLSLSLMVEVRNKLVESYQELMRMPV